MKTKFDDFLNEYGGPGKTLGFPYSKPNRLYDIKLPLSVSSDINMEEMDKNIASIMLNKNIEEDNFKLLLSDDDSWFEGGKEYILNIQMKVYSENEVQSAINVIIDVLVKIYGDKIKVHGDKIVAKGDVPQKKKLGFM